jgi:hypothetical protein
MRNTVLASVALLILVGCSGRTIHDDPLSQPAPDAGSPDSSARAKTEAAVAPSPSTTPTPPYVPGHYGACPDVYGGPVAGLSVDDPGSPGLDELRVRVLQSRDAFNAYAAAHGNTYSFTRQKVRELPSLTTHGNACKDTVNVTGRVVTSVTTAALSQDGPWSEPTLVTNFDSFDTCFSAGDDGLSLRPVSERNSVSGSSKKSALRADRRTRLPGEVQLRVRHLHGRL